MRFNHTAYRSILILALALAAPTAASAADGSAADRSVANPARTAIENRLAAEQRQLTLTQAEIREREADLKVDGEYKTAGITAEFAGAAMALGGGFAKLIAHATTDGPVKMQPGDVRLSRISGGVISLGVALLGGGEGLRRAHAPLVAEGEDALTNRLRPQARTGEARVGLMKELLNSEPSLTDSKSKSVVSQDSGRASTPDSPAAGSSSATGTR